MCRCARTLFEKFSLEYSDVLLVVSPLTEVRSPVLGPHILQGCARAAGIDVSVLYSNLLYALEISPRAFDIYGPRSLTNLGAQLFSWSLRNCDRPRVAGDQIEGFLLHHQEIVGRELPQSLKREMREHLGPHYPFSAKDFMRLSLITRRWVSGLSRRLARSNQSIIGFTTMFPDQLVANLAIASQVKHYNRDKILIFGGTQCADSLGKGIVESCSDVDYVFSGDSEEAFVRFITEMRSGSRSTERFVCGAPNMSLDTIPTPDFADYLQQKAYYCQRAKGFREAPYPEILSEASRGCTWHDKGGCRFCSLSPSGAGGPYRQKAVDTIVRQLGELCHRHPGSAVSLVDLMLPQNVLEEVAETIVRRGIKAEWTFEARPVLTLKQLILLSQSGVKGMQAGIESLSDGILKAMRKGTTVAENLRLLRYCRSVGVVLAYNIIWGIPGDTGDEYREMLELFPLISHLHPPSTFLHLDLEKFSPYMMEPAKYGISDLRPTTVSTNMVALVCDPLKVSYHYVGTYKSGAHENLDLVGECYRQTVKWSREWFEPKHVPQLCRSVPCPATLKVVRDGGGGFQLLDTRGLNGCPSLSVIDYDQARAALVSQRMAAVPHVEWAIRRRVAICRRGVSIPLAFAEPEVMLEFESERVMGEEECMPARDEVGVNAIVWGAPSLGSSRKMTAR